MISADVCEMYEKKKIALIWDLDGTLLDSYPVIVESLYETFLPYDNQLEKEEIHKYVIKSSVTSFIHLMEEKTGIPFDGLKQKYSEISSAKLEEIELIPDAKEVLLKLQSLGVTNFVFTHRGGTTEAVLRKLEVYDCFDEIITSREGFPRKPEPDAVLYLVNKYHLNPENTYYVGDRKIDIECAQNAKIKSILYLPSDSYGERSGFETFVVSALTEIIEALHRDK